MWGLNISDIFIMAGYGFGIVWFLLCLIIDGVRA
jgi:hypothetical protein